MDGEVIGINTAIISPSGGSIGIGFAIPSATAVNVIQQLRDFGETRRGWLGVRIQDITDDIAEGLGMTGVKGALVAGVTESGPAAAAGVLPGDVILEFDGTAIDSSHALPRLVADEPVGKEVALKLLRKGQELTVTAKLGRLEDADKAAAAKDEKPAPAPEANPDAPADVVPGPLGLSLSELTPGMRSQYGIKDEGISGVVVTGVEAGSLGEEKRIEPGDVIVEVGQERVSTPDDVTGRIAQLKKDGRASVQLLLSDRNGILRFVDVKLPD
jgi:serine protease Do